MTYIYELPGWPNFIWDEQRISRGVADIRHNQGLLAGRMSALGFSIQTEASLNALTLDVEKSSEIEGEMLERSQIRSSIARRLGLDIGGLVPSDRNVDGVVEMTLDATHRYDQPLDQDRLFSWHALLFPGVHSGRSPITIGAWRDDSSGAMQVVSGAIGRERVHFEAPPARRVAAEMERFLAWFNESLGIDDIVRAAVAHFWFVTIHPFDDGNGRIARAIADMALARSEKSTARFYSMSAQIRSQRSSYYEVLEATSKGSLDITAWIAWFIETLSQSIDAAQAQLNSAQSKSRFWDRLNRTPMNARQRLVLNRLLDGFEGKLTTSKYAKLAKCSQDTALRDILGLVSAGVLVKDDAGGRSTSYSIAASPGV
jgi:Fic family protein